MSDVLVYCVFAERADDGTAEGLPPDVLIRRWTTSGTEAEAWRAAYPAALVMLPLSAVELEGLPPKHRAEALAKIAE